MDNNINVECVSMPKTITREHDNNLLAALFEIAVKMPQHKTETAVTYLRNLLNISEK